jgi:putative aldouronate transport system permease protein
MNRSAMKRANRIRRSPLERGFDLFNLAFMTLWCLITFYPFWYVLVMSFNTGADAARGPVWFWPRAFTLENYRFVLQYQRLQLAFLVTVARCLAGPVISVVVTIMAAFSISKRYLPFRRALVFFLMLPMFIGGSLISNYVVMVKLGMLNNFLVYIIPGAFGFFGMVIMRTHIDGIPAEIQESAMIDGAGYGRILVQIILPLCKPVLAAFLFFGVVGNWMDYYTNLIYVTRRELTTLQYLLYEIINRTETAALIDFSRDSAANISRVMSNRANSMPTPEVIKMAVMVVVTFPILFVYPFFQKYFVKGIMTGAVKA